MQPWSTAASKYRRNLLSSEGSISTNMPEETLLTERNRGLSVAPFSVPTWCSFTAVICQTNSSAPFYGSVIILDLYDKSLTGTLPTEMGLLTALREFDVSRNQIHGKIPTTISLMSSLTLLVLIRNMLTGTVPDFFVPLSKLQHLDANTNDLTGTLPSSLGSLMSLTSVSFASNSMSGTIPRNLGNLASSLRNLDLSKNHFTSTIPRTISLLTVLTNFDVNSNYLTMGAGASTQNSAVFSQHTLDSIIIVHDNCIQFRTTVANLANCPLTARK